MKQTKLASICLTSVLAHELGGSYKEVFLKEAKKEAGEAKVILINMSKIDTNQIEALSELLIKQAGI